MTSDSKYRYVILGGGLAAGYASQAFVEHGVGSGELCIISAEKLLPYERPPLSKGFLAGEEQISDILINDPSFYEEHGIIVKRECRVKEVDLDERVLYANGEAISYERLLIATGARPRRFELPGADLQDIYYLREVEDARQIRARATDAERAVVIGGGFIGMEATSVLQEQGVETTLVFPEERVWQAFFTPQMSEFFESYYRERGVKIVPQEGIDSFDGEARVAGVKTESGTYLPADLVVAGIGVVPNVELFEASELLLSERGILVNRFLETNIPDVFAAGDVTEYKDPLYGRPMHVEHWDNAVEQGKHAARAMLGEYQPYNHVPYFFSDEFDLSYEYWGDGSEAEEVVHRGDVSSGSFSVWWLDGDGRLVAAFVLDRPDEERELAPKWIAEGKMLEASWLRESPRLQP